MVSESGEETLRALKRIANITLAVVFASLVGLVLLPGLLKLIPFVGMVVTIAACTWAGWVIVTGDGKTLPGWMYPRKPQDELRWQRASFWWSYLAACVVAALLVCACLGFIFLGEGVWQLLALPFGTLGGLMLLKLVRVEDIVESMHRNSHIE